MRHQYSGLYCPQCLVGELDHHGECWEWCNYVFSESDPPLTKEESLKRQVAKQQRITDSELQRLNMLKRELAEVDKNKEAINGCC